MRFSWSLKRALLLSFVAATVLPILILGVLTARYFERKQLETHSLLINSHALSVSREALEFINNTQESLALVKQALHSGLLPGRSEIDQYLQLTVDSSTSFEAIYLLDQDYRVTHLGLSKENNKPRVEYLGLDLSAYEVFSQQHDFNRPVWSDSYISPITAVPSLSLLIPLEQGFLLGTVGLQRVSDELAKRLLHVGGGYQFSLLDDLGVVIADTRPGLASKRFNMRFHPEVRDALDHQVEIPSKYHEDSSLLESVHLVPGTGWVAYVSLPIDEVKKSVASLRVYMLGVLASAALLGILFSLWLSRRILNPVLFLRDAVGEVARGNYSHTLQSAPHEELEDLSRSFRDMAAAVEHREQSIRESEKRMQRLSVQFQSVLQAIPDHIMILEQDLSVVWLNWLEDDSRLAGESLLKDLRCYELPGSVCAIDEETAASYCNTCLVTQTFCSGQQEEALRKRADGRTFSLRTFPVFDEVGDVVNVILIIQDISESLRQQEQATRTGQLAALGELAAGVAHEINNPINGVINYAQLILNKAAENSRERDLSQRIIHESERIAAIVRELLYFAREESSEIHQIAMRDAVSEALVLLKNSLHKEGVELRVQLPETLPMIRSRSHQVQQLIMNLVSNALYALKQKYPGPDPNKIIWIKGEARQKGHQAWVRLTVRDHGVGIPKDILPRVMNPFVTTKPSAEGTGLGLSISHEIAKKHGGTLGIESIQGEYTEAVVDLPAVTSLMN